MELILYWLATAVLLLLAVWLAGLFAQTRSLAALFTLIVAIGLVYDNGIIAAGSLIGTGPLLEALNWPRYVIHAFATPLLVIVALDLAQRYGLAWSTRTGWSAAFWVLTVLLVAYGVVVELLPLSLVAESSGGVTSYAPAGGSGFPLPAMVTMVALTAVGVLIWVRKSWPWLGLGAILAFIGFGVAPALDFTVLGQFAEVVLIGGISLSESRLAQQHRRVPKAA